MWSLRPGERQKDIRNSNLILSVLNFLQLELIRNVDRANSVLHLVDIVCFVVQVVLFVVSMFLNLITKLSRNTTMNNSTNP